MIKVKATIDTSDIRKKLREYGRMFSIGIADGLREAASQTSIKLANQTQPFNGKPGDDATFRKSKNKVFNDVNRVFYTAVRSDGKDSGFVKEVIATSKRSNNRKYKSSKASKNAQSSFEKRIRTYARGNNKKALQKIAKDFNWQGVLNHIDHGIMQKSRTGRRGNVPKNAKKYLVLTRNKNLRTYAKSPYSRIGFAKAGWITAQTKIKVSHRKGDGIKGKIPKWVKRYKGKAPGFVRDTTKNLKNPSIQIVNAVPWINKALSSSAKRQAVRIGRQNFIKYINSKMKGEIKRLAKLKGG